MPLPTNWQNTLFGSSFRRSPQGDGGNQANGMQQMGQQGSAQPTQFNRPPQNAGMQSGGPQTFAQMQGQGMARPAPQMVGGYAPSSQQGVGGDELQRKVSDTLQTPGRYDTAAVQQMRDAATNQMNTQFGAQRREIDETLAKRGILSSSMAGGYYGDLAGQQAQAMASMNADLLGRAADASAADRGMSLGAGQNLQNALSQQGLAGYAANLQAAQQNNQANIAQGQLGQGQQAQDLNRMLGLGGLDLQAGGLTGQFGGQQTLGGQQQQLAQMLGLGGLGLQQGQLGVEQARLAQQGQQFGQSLQEQQAARGQQFGLQERQQGAQEGQFGQSLGEQAAGRMQQGQQFGQSLGEQQAARGQEGAQFNQQQQLAQMLGLGNLGLEQQRVANQAGQFGQSQQQQAGQFDQQFGLQQKEQELNRMVQTGQLTLAQAQQQLAQLQNQQQFGLQGQAQNIQQQQFGQSQAQSQAQFAANLELQRADLTARYGSAEADRMIEQQKIANQASQFTAGQLQQGDQFGRSLTEQMLGRNQQSAQFGQGLQEQVAARLQQEGQFGRDIGQQQAARTQQGEQFTQSLGEQQAGRVQQNTQFQNQLAQMLGISTADRAEQGRIADMQDFTTGRGITAQQAGNNNALMMQLMGVMGGLSPEQVRAMFAGGGVPGGETPAQKAEREAADLARKQAEWADWWARNGGGGTPPPIPTTQTFMPGTEV